MVKLFEKTLNKIKKIVSLHVDKLSSVHLESVTFMEEANVDRKYIEYSLKKRMASDMLEYITENELFTIKYLEDSRSYAYRIDIIVTTPEKLKRMIEKIIEEVEKEENMAEIKKEKE